MILSSQILVSVYKSRSYVSLRYLGDIAEKQKRTRKSLPHAGYDALVVVHLRLLIISIDIHFQQPKIVTYSSEYARVVN